MGLHATTKQVGPDYLIASNSVEYLKFHVYVKPQGN